MTQDEIIRMAREAGFDLATNDSIIPILEHFAALVATHAKSEQINLAYQQGYEEGSAHEREACAKVADGELMNTNILTSYPPKSSAAWSIASAIRARGEK